MTSQLTLERLEWDELLTRISSKAQTKEAQSSILKLKPDLKKQDDILQSWTAIESLKSLIRLGYTVPIGEMPEMAQIFLSAEKGQILDGVDFRSIAAVLASSKKVLNFCHDFGSKSKILAQFQTRLYPLPKLSQAIEKAVGPTGQLLDDASPELKELRKQKISLRKRIEELLAKLMVDSEISTYLQDQFFTLRNDKYVLPIRIDGRGRVKGSVVSTSDSGQTLFFEPMAVIPFNEKLQELDIAERLEIIRIFRELSVHVSQELEVLRINYATLIEIDELQAKAVFASEKSCGSVKLTENPCISLIGAFHPTMEPPKNQMVVRNDITLEEDQNTLIISGPNAGGKTVVLKTVGICHLMASAGLLVPADETSQMYLFENCFVEMGDAQNLSANLSTFSGHLMGLKPILEKSTARDLVLIDELASGTEPQTGAALAQAMIETLSLKNVTSIVTTHFDALKGLAFDVKVGAKYRNASMEYLSESLKPTYRLVLDVPGQSYGIELAQEIGFDVRIIARARDLKGHSATMLDSVLEDLSNQRQRAQRIQSELEQKLLAAEQEKQRWQNECDLLKESRQKAAKSLSEKYESQISDLRNELESVTSKLKGWAKKIDDDDLKNDLIQQKQKANLSVKEMQGTLRKLDSEYSEEKKLPGRQAEFEDLKKDAVVYIVPLAKEGHIVNAPDNENDPFDVKVGMIKLRTSMRDVRILEKNVAQKKQSRPQEKTASREKETLEFVPKTPTNSVDLRGMELDEATKITLEFLDRSMLRGENAVILVHGHGTDALKTGLRSMLKNECPYDVSFRPGIMQEGGDGVTVVFLG